MITFHEFYAKAGQVNMDEVRRLLKEEGLVGPRNDPFGRTEEKILVWEDEKGIGRYRAHICENDTIADGTLADGVRFAYWMARKDRSILERDPMKEMRERIYEMFRGKLYRDIKNEGTIEEFLADGSENPKPN